MSLRARVWRGLSLFLDINTQNARPEAGRKNADLGAWPDQGMMRVYFMPSSDTPAKRPA